MKNLFLCFALLLSLSACTGGSVDSPGVDSSVEVSEINVLTYDSTQAQVNVVGKVNISGALKLSEMEFYLDSACAGSSLGKTLLQNFEKDGVNLTVSSQSSSKIYTRINSVAGCFFVTAIKPGVDSLPAPVFGSSIPASPSRSTTTPAVKGEASPFAQKIDFYSDSSCSTQIGSGTRSAFVETGIPVTVEDNASSPIYAQAVEAFGKRSPCSLLFTYVHADSGPVPPTFVLTAPLSPNPSTHPIVQGVSSVPVANVYLYGDSACSVQLATGTAEELAAGLEITVSENVETPIYAKSVDSLGFPSICNYFTTYLNDNIAPGVPTYTIVSPSSPTRLTLYPKFKGTSPADTQWIKLYDSSLCNHLIGSGTKAEYEGAGIAGRVTANQSTLIYATSLDLSGNASACTFLTDFTHDDIAPNPPVFGGTTPLSPNNFSVTPLVYGQATLDTVSISMYKDNSCTDLVGTGTGSQFNILGVLATLPDNAITSVYGTAVDLVGNVSECSFLMSYAHSTQPAPSPSFISSVPASPSNTSYRPWILGSVASTVKRVNLYNDASCTLDAGSGTRTAFISTGIQITLPQNAISDVYAISTDIYENVSPCVHLVQYTHTNIIPYGANFSASVPVSPNNFSTFPTLSGTVLANPAAILPPLTVVLYDSLICVNQLSSGSLASYSSGIPTVVPSNNTTSVYAKVFDAAGNSSSCDLQTTYTHDALNPAKPLYSNTTPASPSYTRNVLIRGGFGASTDFLPMTTVEIFSDASCTASIGSGPPEVYNGSGLGITVPQNTTSTLYGRTTNLVGNMSACSLLTTFFHNDLGPSGLNATQNGDGSVRVSWQPDATANPSPTYQVKRSVAPGGPYTVVNWENIGNTFIDYSVNNDTTYYYVVAGSNSTGTSYDSAEASISLSIGGAGGASSLVASPGPAEATISWIGFGSNMYYKVYRATQTGGPYTLVKSDLQNTLYIDRNLTNDVSYYYVVIGTNPSGQSLQSNEARVVPRGVPSPPANLKMELTLSHPVCGGLPGINLSWTAPAYYDSFQVYRGANPGVGNVLSTTGATQFVDCNPTNYSGNYNNYYAVAAIWGSQVSALSNVVRLLNVGTTSLSLNPGDNEIFVSWTPLSNADRYDLYRGPTNTGPFTKIGNQLSVSSYYDSAVANGTAYFYYVLPTDTSGYSIWPSTVVSAIPGNTPVAPTNLLMTISAAKPLLKWSEPTHFNAFNVYRASSPGGPFTYISKTTTTTFADLLPLTGMNYYRVTATWGAFETPPTNVVSFRSGQVTGLVATPTASDIALSWSPVTGVQDYQIWRGDAYMGPFALVQTTVSTNWTDTSVVAGNGYFYKIVSSFADGSFGQASITVGSSLTGNALPLGVTVTATSSASVSLSWTPVSGATSYNLYKSTSLGGTYTLSAIAVAPQISGVVSSLLPQTEYFFKVTSLNGAVESAFSAAVSAKTFNTPSAPNVTPGNNTVDLVWNTEPGGLTYDIQRSSDGVSFATVVSGLATTTYQDTTVTNGQIYFYRTVVNHASGSLTSGISVAVTPGLAPNVPAGLSIDDNSTGNSITVSWAKLAGATTYRLYVYGTSGGPYGSPVLNTASNTNNIVGGLVAGTTYYLSLSALKGTIESAKSVEISVVPGVTPVAPTGLVNSSGNIDLSWPAVAGATTYDILRSDNRLIYSTIASGVAGTTYTDTSAVALFSYTYIYRPRTAAGVAMPDSLPSQAIAPGVFPLTPTELVAEIITGTDVNLSWIKSPQVSSYLVYRSGSTGGPYSLLASLAASTSSYLDTTGVGGATYYYVVTAKNSSGVESPYSNERGVSLVAAPTGLVATPGVGQIDVSWSAYGGAVSYNLYRAISPTAEFQKVASATGSLSFSDTQVLANVPYYYRVAANLASGALSPYSSQATATAASNYNLEIPVELLDRPFSSSNIAITLERSQTGLSTDDYDGVVSYFFEVVAENHDASPVSIDLLNAASSTVSSIAIPANTSEPQRFRVAFVATAGAQVYRLKLNQSSAAGLVVVHSARMLVRQTGATKTKIYYPMFSSLASASFEDTLAPAATTTVATYGALDGGIIFQRDTSQLDRISDHNAWELEVVVGGINGGTGLVTLQNATTNAAVGATETFITTSTPKHIKIPFDEGVSEFGASNELQKYQVSMLCQTNCSSGSVALYKAGLWVRLKDLSKAQLHYRTALGKLNWTVNGVVDTQRTLIDSSKFSNPVYYFVAIAKLANLGTASIELHTSGSNDFGLLGTSVIAGSPLSIIDTDASYVKSAAPVILNSNDRFLPYLVPSGNQVDFTSSLIIVNTTK